MSVVQRLVRAGLTGAGARSYSAATRPNVVDISKLKSKQQAFQKNDGLPVFLKGGTGDKVLYYTTWAMCLTGLAGFVHLIYDIEFGEKEQ